MREGAVGPVGEDLLGLGVAAVVLLRQRAGLPRALMRA
jgi:hypothetical protein